MKLDNIDLKILKQLQEDCRQPNVDLAEEVGLSPPACLKRLKRLRESGVIHKEVALLDAKLAGNGLNLVVSVEMERDRADIYRQFSAAVQAAPEVMECYQVSGETDFVLIVSVADVEAYERFIDRVLHSDPNIRKFHTAISIRRVKYTTAFDLDRA